MPQYYKMIGLSGESDQANKNIAPNNNDVTSLEPISKHTKGVGGDSGARKEKLINRVGATTFNEHEEVAIITVETNLFTAIVSSWGGGTLQSYTLNNYSLWEGGKVNLIDTTINGKNPMLAYRLGAELDTLSLIHM